MEKSIHKITIGIRYRRSFRIPDISGKVIDYILHDDKSPFRENFFQEVGETSEKGKILVSEKKDFLSIDIDSLILSLNTNNLESALTKIKDSYFPYFTDSIFKEFEIENINRLGIIFEHRLEKLDSIDKMTKELSLNEISAPDNFELRFSKKLPTTAGLISKNIVDFYNTIFTYQKNSKGIDIKLDYQLYFSPEIGSIQDVEFNKFIDSAKSYLLGKFYKW